MKRFWMMTAGPVALATCMAGVAAPVMAQERVAAISPQERQQGAQANAGIIAEYGGAMSGRQATYVEQVGRKVAVQSGLSSSPGAFDVTLLNSPVNNAFAIPGGYIYVTRQLLALMNDEAELAGVLGHEVGHVAARHSAKRQSAAQRNSILGAIGQAIVGATVGSSTLGSLLNQGIGTGAQLATLGYSRGQETQSDSLGIRYLVKAGYDPEAMASVLDSLASQTALDQQLTGDARSTPAWASTHPEPGARVDRAAREAAQARPPGGQRGRDAFLAAIDGMMYGDDPQQGVIEGQDFIYPPAKVAFTAPQGFRMQNSTKAVTIAGQGGQAQFSTGAYDGDIGRYASGVLSKLGGGSGEVRRTTINGIPAAITGGRATSGRSQVDVTVVAYAVDPKQAYHFVILAQAGQGAGALGGLAESFRRMTAADTQKARPRFVRVVTVKNGDTPRTLSSRMAYDDTKLDRFLVLNRLSADEPLRAGDKVKVVTF